MNVLSYAKRLTALILCAVLLLGLMPVGAFATEAEGETTAPVGETTAPVSETTAPAEETTAPAEETTAPAPGKGSPPKQAPTSDGVKAPSEETTAPAEETTAPAEETTAPVGETTAPVGETTAPAEGETTAPNVEDKNIAQQSEAQANEDGTLTIPGSAETYTENVYVRVDSLTAGGKYLIVNVRSGSGVALTNNNGTISKVDVNVLVGDDGAFIVLDDATAVWTAAQGITLSNNGQNLGIDSSSNLVMDGEYNTWSYGNNVLYPNNEACGTKYLNYSATNGWTVSSSQQNMYLYEYKADGTTATIPDVTYSVSVATSDGAAGTYTAKYVTNETTLDLTAAVTADHEGYEENAAGGTYAWSSSNEAVATVDANGKVTFTGKGGTTTIRATYTLGEYVIWGEIIITAEPAGYKLQIVDAEKNSLDGTYPVKGQEAINAGLDLDALVTLEKSAEDIEEITDANVTWTVSDESIASIGSDGKLTFTGTEGVVTVTATYTDPNGEQHVDTLNVSVSKSLYFTPTDGTNDFPEYPNEGAIRIDKNAVAVGNFSDTGVAKVELSMTGVPYSVGNEIDVVIMIDMSDSMKNNNVGRVQPARESAVNALEAIVKNEDGTINNNRVAVYTFNGYDSGSSTQNYANAIHEVLSLRSYQNASNKNDTTNLTNAQSSITSWIQNNNTGAGTNYGAALEKCYSVLKAAKEENPNRKQFVIFVTDGEPTTGFAYETSDGGVKDDGYNSNYSDGAADVYYTYTEYYSKQMRNAGVEVYSVGIQLTNSNANTILKKIGGNSTGDAYNNSTTHSDYAQFISSDESADKLVTIFEDIVNAIKEAATNVTVTDKITDEYTLILKTPENVTLPDGTALTIDVLQYTLDADKNRTGEPVVIESIALDSEKVTKDADGNIISIVADNFTYDASTHIITWKADKLDTTELALSYYLYLENSAGYDAENQTEAGTYPTNEYATISYTNHLDHQCKKEFPEPQLTWNGAQVSYTFYLVNAQGQPVNRAGRVIPFAEAIYVTDVYTETVTWDTDEDKALSAEKIAAELLPEVYTLYDSSTSYTINVFEDETGKDLGNHFIIAAEKMDVTGEYTTKVFNTKAGIKYSTPGRYTADDVFTGFDFANTTVAFAVIWTADLAPDTVIVDYGLDVVIDVTTNDALESKVVGVRADAPEGVTMNSGKYSAAKAQSADVNVNNKLMGTASVESLTSVRFSLNKDNGMQFADPAVFYYESEASYYQNNVLQTVYMYSSVTVIPATTIYYEDEFVELKTYTDPVEEENDDGTTTTTYTENKGWVTVGTAANATQQQDRPGESQISDTIDADNNYGYDAAYTAMSKYSLGTAAMVNVTTGKYATAEFTFYGTGFDVISMTSNTTGTLTVKVVDESGNSVKNMVVDTYYGYTKNADGEWVATPDKENALYQVPVIKAEGLTYGKYTVTITASYVELFDHTTPAGYDLYLDAIRIYDPANDGASNKDVEDAYKADGEGWPSYIELRNKLIKAETFNQAITAIDGEVFIDGEAENKSIDDYTSYGPNNELYLASGQSIAFQLGNLDKVAKIQLGIKSADGNAVTYTIQNITSDGTVSNAKTATISTATDMYYDITDWKDGIIVITNSGDAGIISLTNIKATYTENPNAAVVTSEDDTEDVPSETNEVYTYMTPTAATLTLRALNAPAVVEPEETEPETTEPETTEPETTEPETTEPETTEPETTEPETTEPEEKPSEGEAVREIVKGIIKIIGRLFGRWF